MSKASRRLKDGLIKAYARGPAARLRYRDAWLLIDRDSQAQDNAEHFYRYLRREHPEVNVWFVLSQESNDWTRLRRDGFRLVPHKTRQHTFALLNCRHVISSQVDHYIVQPLPRRRFGMPTWSFTFLQHGVTHNDLSVWINPKRIDLMITATPAEHRSIVGDYTPYVLTSHEVSMAGFPRHDRLLGLTTSTRTRRVLVAPTWRRELLTDPVAGGNDRGLQANFWSSRYALEWRRLLESERLARVAEEHGLEVSFVPHPNMQEYVEEARFSAHVDVLRFKDVDIQQVLAESAVLVTDYSSLAFEVGYMSRPVVYFQFDRDQFFSGTHAFRRGTWSYEEEGFGPVTVEFEDCVTEIVRILERGGTPASTYANRMDTTFPLRDGRCSERTFAAIKAMESPARGEK